MKNRKVHNSNGPIPGCLGRMVNLFDINPRMVENKRLTDKAHFEGSRSRSDAARLIRLIEDRLENNLLKRNASDRTPMKMLIDHEMSKEEEPKQNPPSLVAKLMGLDTLPRRNNDSVLHQSQSKSNGTSSKMISEKPRGNKLADTGLSDKQRKCEADYLNQKEYKDLYEIWKQALGEKLVRGVSTQKGMPVNDLEETKMTLVRQKFVEAKRLVTDEKLRQTKAFQEALEFRSSNRDLFLKCLEEQQFIQEMYGKCTIPVAPKTQRITVLKTSMTQEDEKSSLSENKNRKPARKPVPVAVAHGRSKSNDECSSTFSHWDTDHSVPTRIVVLKPSVVNAQGIGTMVSSNSSSLKTVNVNFFNESEVYDTNESREVAKEITGQMRDKLMGRKSDETLHSSLFSNGYTGDESSMNKSDNEFDGESDSEVTWPTSRHSWDYINRFSSPFSSASLSRVSCSPESSVCQEAKKRLSERWAMVALHGKPPEHRHVRRGSCTLGEMLALSDTKKTYISEDIGSKETSGLMAYISPGLDKDEKLPEPSRSLLRSKSVPLSSSVYVDRQNVELSGPVVVKPEESEDMKCKSTMLSLKGKVSSLFFSKNKKVKKASSNVSGPENVPHVNKLGTSEHFIGKNGDIASGELGLSFWRTNDNHDQPSPISVLEMPFEDNGTCAMEFASCSRQEQGRALGDHLKSCLIDKSPPIGSISRTIPWKDPFSDTGAAYTVSLAPLESESEEDWLVFVQTVLADSGISDKVQSDALSTIWHSPDSPLDPSIREKYINQNDKALASAANLRQWRSRCKLMYDSVNAALVDIAYSRTPEPNHGLQHPDGSSLEGHSRIPLTNDVWTRIKEWKNYDARSIVGVDADSQNSLLVESVVKNEVVGKSCEDIIRVETNEVGKEIEEKLLEELVEDAVRYCIDREYWELENRRDRVELMLEDHVYQPNILLKSLRYCLYH